MSPWSTRPVGAWARAIADALAAEGAHLVISSRKKEAIEAAAAEIAAAHGGDVVAVAADVSQSEAAPQLVEVARDRFGGLDILVNNSGGPPGGTFGDFDDDAWQSAFELLVAKRRPHGPGLSSPFAHWRSRPGRQCCLNFGPPTNTGPGPLKQFAWSGGRPGQNACR